MYLAHHGVKGMKWGVRRYQNKDGTLTALGKKRKYENPDGTLTELGKRQYLKTWNRMSRDIKDSIDYSRHPEKYDPVKEAVRANKTGKIPKGTKLYRATYSPDESIGSDRKYVTLSKEAAKIYADPEVLKWVDKNTGDPGHMITYESIKDLKIASSKEVVDFVSKHADNPAYFSEAYEMSEKMANRVQKRLPKNSLEQLVQDYKADGEYYVMKQSRSVLLNKYDTESEAFKHFRKLGYDAISDIEDGGVEGWYAPAIILNPSESIKEVSRTKIKENNYRYSF